MTMQGITGIRNPGSMEGSQGNLVSEIPYVIHPQEQGLLWYSLPTVFYNVPGKLILNFGLSSTEQFGCVSWQQNNKICGHSHPREENSDPIDQTCSFHSSPMPLNAFSCLKASFHAFSLTLLS